MDDKTMNPFRTLRTILGFTQKRFADETGLAYDVVGNLETGRTPARPEVIEMIAHRFGLDGCELEKGLIRRNGAFPDEDQVAVMRQQVVLPQASIDALKRLLETLLDNTPNPTLVVSRITRLIHDYSTTVPQAACVVFEGDETTGDAVVHLLNGMCIDVLNTTFIGKPCHGNEDKWRSLEHLPPRRTQGSSSAEERG